jgi:NAD(P)-dependent dehydrogenase (short-subunit alcohol dehydrogenase family)
MGSYNGRQCPWLLLDVAGRGTGDAQGRLGRIVSVSSRAAFRAGAKRTAYAASKAAIVGFTKSLAFDLAPCGITVNAVLPGPIRTSRAISTNRRELGDDLEIGFRERANAIPIGRCGTPDDVASMIAYLASDAAAFITG